MSIYLYLKTHNKTGLKYLGKTEQDPYKYKGSGRVWQDHLKKHGYDVTTKILYETDSLDDFINVALDYSNKWNIVESKEFANLVPEAGQSGTGELNPFYGKRHTEEHKRYLSEINKGENNSRYGVKVSDETRQRMIEAKTGKNHPHYGKKQEIVTCPYCNKQGGMYALKRWHFDNCKAK